MSVSMLSAHGNNAKQEFNHEIDSLFSAIYNSPTNPGAAVLVMKDGHKVFEKCYGIADINTMKPITPKTNFNIASVSKQFSAIAVLQLMERGKLKLTDNLPKFFPEFKADFFSKVTLHNLLSHTSGIPDYHPSQEHDYVYYSTDIESCKYLKDLPKLNFEPGTKYEYINMTFQLIYQIIPRVTGIDFETYMKKNIFDVAGMNNTVYFEKNRKISNMAHGYSLNPKTNRYEENDYGEARFFATKADGGLYTSLNDFAKWEKALHNNTLISATTKELAYTPKINIPKGAEYGYNINTGYGYGFFIQQNPGKPKIVYHLGDNGGFTIYAGKIPEKDIVVLFFSNRDDIDRIATADKIYKMIEKANYFAK